MSSFKKKEEEESLRAKLTILPMYQIHLSNVNTIYDLRLTSLPLHLPTKRAEVTQHSLGKMLSL